MLARTFFRQITRYSKPCMIYQTSLFNFSTNKNNEEDLASPASFHIQKDQEEKIESARNSVNLDSVDLYEQFTENYEADEDDASRESAAKNISLKLLKTTDPEEVMSIFESEIVRKPGRKVHPEELVLILKFLQHAIQETYSTEPEMGIEFLQKDLRVQTLV